MTDTTTPPAHTAPLRKKLVIHSGTFKTGSTAIQLYLDRASRAGVLQGIGVSYPMAGRTTGIQHANLDAELRRNGVFMPRRGGWKQVIREAVDGDAHTTIVSSEALSTLEPEHLQRIAELTAPEELDVHWVHYVRDQPSLYNSFYVERLIIMRPDTRDLINLPYEDFGTWTPTDLAFFRHASFVESVIAALPAAEMTVRPFVRDHMVGGDSVKDFCHAVGVPFVPQHGGRANVGSGWRTVETARRLLPVIDQADLGSRLEHAGNRPAALQRWLQHIRGELVTAGTAAGWNQESAIYMTPEIRERLLEEYHDENLRLDALVDFPWLEIVEARPMKPFNVGNFDEICGEELMQVLARVLARVYDMPEDVKAMIRPKKRVAPPPPPPPRSFGRRAAGAARRRLRSLTGKE